MKKSSGGQVQIQNSRCETGVVEKISDYELSSFFGRKYDGTKVPMTIKTLELKQKTFVGIFSRSLAFIKT